MSHERRTKQGKRGRNSKSNYQGYKGRGHLRPPRKKEKQKDRADVLNHADTGRNTEYTEALWTTAIYSILAKHADFSGRPFVCRLKALTP